MKIIIIAISTLFLFTGCTSPKKGTETEVAKKTGLLVAIKKKSNILTCSMKKVTRTLEIKPKEKGCELHYTKNGETKVVARSKKAMSHCQKSEAKIQSALAAAGYKCD